MKAIVKTDFNLPGQAGKYVGKVRDVYDIAGKYLVMVVTDRISAFDVVLPKEFLQGTDIEPDRRHRMRPGHPSNWCSLFRIRVTVGYKCEPFSSRDGDPQYPLAMHGENTRRQAFDLGCLMPDGMVENQKFLSPWSPDHEGVEGRPRHLQEEIIAGGLVGREDYENSRPIPADFRAAPRSRRRRAYPRRHKYEFGKRDGDLPDGRSHTPDSSRYFYADGYASV